jgi:PAS domain S-box-containing protein
VDKSDVQFWRTGWHRRIGLNGKSTSGLKLNHLALPRLGISSQVYLFVFALVCALVITTALAWVDAGQQAIQRYESEIEDSLQVFQADFSRATRDLNALGTWLVGQETLADLAQSRDTGALARYLEPWTEVNIADSIIVADATGVLLTQVGIGEAVPLGSSLVTNPGVAEALSGKKTLGLALDPAGRLQGRVVLPWYALEAKSPSGVILLAFHADGTFLKYQARRPDQEIALVYNDTMFILTLTDSQGQPWVNASLPTEVLKASRENRPSEFLTIETEIGKYLFRFRPLEASSSVKPAMYGVGISLATIDRERLSLFRTFGLGILLIAIGATMGGFVFVRALTIPLRILDHAAQEMAQGDLSKSIRLQRNDELGDLARHMESMRQQLLRALGSATLEKSRYAAVIRDMGIAAVVTDRNLNIVSVNPVAEALLGQRQAELEGQPWGRVFVNGKETGSTVPSWGLEETQGAGEQNFALHGHLHLRARPQKTIDVLSTPVEAEGTPAGYVHILQDASAQEQLVRAQDEFIMNAAHELRGPLASLRASIELLVEDYAVMPKQELAVMLRTLQRAIVKFQGLVENIVDIGNIQAGRFRVRPKPTRLDHLVADVLTQINPLLIGRAQRVQLRLEGPAPCMVSADRPRIMQVLINLITNASKYGPEGQAIDLHAFPKDEFIIIEVTDCGPGIPPEEQANLFQRFYRGRRAEEEGIGIGLGLALAREIVTAHGGQMEVESKVGEGTTFWFSLPKADPVQSSAGKVA